MMWTAVFITALVVHSKAINILCGNDSDILEVIEDSKSFNITCYNYRSDKEIVWSYTNLNKSKYNVGKCTPNTCDGSLQKIKISSLSHTRSLLISQYTGRKSDGFIYTCSQNDSNASCIANIIYPADVQLCTLILTSSPWELNGTCVISKVYSSLGRYECQLYYKTSSEINFINVYTAPYVPGTHTNPEYRKGACTFTSTLPSSSGSYNYMVVVHPGKTQYVFEKPIIIEPPSKPVISNCLPNSIIPEGSNLTCICSVENIGKPHGRLMWYGDGTLKHTGSYGATSLWMNETIGLRNDGMKLECVVEWSNTSNKCLHVVNVTSKPHSMMFTINNGSSSVTVTEGEGVIFECLASGKPLPTLHVIGQNNFKPIYSNISHKNNTTYLRKRLPNVNCTNTDEYTCVAGNNITESIIEKVKMFVNCKPRRTETPALTHLDVINNGTAAIIMLNFVAFPGPENFTFVRLDSSMGTASIAFQVKCRSLQRVYMHMCYVDIGNVTSNGYYKVIVSNLHGRFEMMIHIKFPNEDNSKANYGPVIGGMIGSSILIGLFLVALFVIIKRRRKGSLNMHVTQTKEDYVYATVKKPKKPKNRFSEAAAEDNDESKMSSPSSFQAAGRYGDTTTKHILFNQSDDINQTLAVDNIVYTYFECEDAGPQNLNESSPMAVSPSVYASVEFTQCSNEC